jgi:hypothetical protein
VKKEEEKERKRRVNYFYVPRLQYTVVSKIYIAENF